MNGPEPRQAWYLRCSSTQVAPRAVLVGDRGRVMAAADLLTNVEILNKDRGLTTVTGRWREIPVTISAFGMGAAVASIVLHELASLGVRTVARLGTTLAVGAAHLGDFVVADSALRGESTSGTYVPAGFPAAPDLDLTLELRAAAAQSGTRVCTGMIASYDGFYSQLFADGQVPHSSTIDIDRLVSLGVVGLDMETSAVLAVGRALGLRSAALCLASVDGRSHKKLEGEERSSAERDLLTAGLDALCRSTTGSQLEEHR